MKANTSIQDIDTIETMLAASGITTTLVDSCDDERCPWCEPDSYPLAA